MIIQKIFTSDGRQLCLFCKKLLLSPRRNQTYHNHLCRSRHWDSLHPRTSISNKDTIKLIDETLMSLSKTQSES